MATEDWERMALVGQVARPHGRRGEVVVNPATDFPDARFQIGRTVFLRSDGQIRPIALASVRFHRGRPILGLPGVDTIAQAEQLAGAEFRVPTTALAPLPPGTFYRHDLVGCRVETVEGGVVGTVRAVDGARGASHLVVSGPRGEIFIPLAASICVGIEPGGGRIVIEPPDGLLDLNVSPALDRAARRGER